MNWVAGHSVWIIPVAKPVRRLSFLLWGNHNNPLEGKRAAATALQNDCKAQPCKHSSKTDQWLLGSKYRQEIIRSAPPFFILNHSKKAKLNNHFSNWIRHRIIFKFSRIFPWVCIQTNSLGGGRIALKSKPYRIANFKLVPSIYPRNTISSRETETRLALTSCLNKY